MDIIICTFEHIDVTPKNGFVLLCTVVQLLMNIKNYLLRSHSTYYIMADIGNFAYPVSENYVHEPYYALQQQQQLYHQEGVPPSSVPLQLSTDLQPLYTPSGELQHIM